MYVREVQQQRHVLPGFAREGNSTEASWICIQSSLPSKRDSTRESTEMTKTTIAGKGQARLDDVTSNQMTGKMGTSQTSF